MDEDEIVESVADKIAPTIQNWICEEFAPEVENWMINEFAPGIQNWVCEEFSPEVENWLNEEYSPKLEQNINESIKSNKENNLDLVSQTLELLENIQDSKPTYPSKSIITENQDEPKYIQEMPADARVKWDMASKEVRESIERRAKLYNFIDENAIQRFWSNINFEEIKPIANIYEGLNNIEDEQERMIRAKLRASRFRKF